MGLVNSIVTWGCIVLMCVLVLWVIVGFIVRAGSREKSINYLRSFKKGKCTIIYFIAGPLYLIGRLYAGEWAGSAFFMTIKNVIELVVLKFDMASVSKLMEDSRLYTVAICILFTLVTVNAMMFGISIFNQFLWQSFQRIKAVLSRKDRLYIFGANEKSQNIYKSDKSRTKFVIDKLSTEQKKDLYLKKINCIYGYKFDLVGKRIIRYAFRNRGKRYTIILNMDCDEANLKICKGFIDSINEWENEEKVKYDKRINVIKRRYQLFEPLISKIDIIQKAYEQKLERLDREYRELINLYDRLNIYVFGDPRFETVYSDVSKKAYGCIHCINKYKKIAINFIEKYPFSRFMNESQMDYDTSLLKEDVDINVCILGFGDTAQQILLTSVANNQFLYDNKGVISLKPINYHIYDKNNIECNKNLNHTYYRYKIECLEKIENNQLSAEKYLPLPALPATEKYELLDINSPEFYRDIYSVISSQNSVNFIIISFGTDLENIDMAQKIVAKKKEWGIDKLTIFIKSRNISKEESFLNEEDCYFIGYEKEDVYNINEIENDSISKMAQMRNEVYDLEREVTESGCSNIDSEKIVEIRKRSKNDWYRVKSQMERESSLYGCLSLRSKLNMMGLDYIERTKLVNLIIDNTKKTDEKYIYDEQMYLNKYAKGDLPEYVGGLKADGKAIINYGIDFRESRRKTMAIQEHQRWNSFMISKGMIPATKEQILTEKNENNKYTNGKNYAVRRHGNLTTFDGLVEFRQLVAGRDNVDEVSKDVIKYDYQILDDAYWLLSKNGYIIVPKEMIDMSKV